MENSNRSASDLPDLARLLPREAFQEIVVILCGALPSPAGDEAGDRVVRDRAAMEAVVALRPGNAAEGRLAAQFVMADAWAADCLREADERRLEVMVARRCLAQGASLLRESKSSLRLLFKLQAARQAVEKLAEEANRTPWVKERVAASLSRAPARAVSAAVIEIIAPKTGPAPHPAIMNRHQRRETAARLKHAAA